MVGDGAPAPPARASEDDRYDPYVRREWELFARDPARAAAAREVASELMTIRRVLDIGCGAGQELRPFVRSGQALGVGVDVSAHVGDAGRELFAQEEPGSRVAFVRGGAEDLPFGSSSFDVVICRLALPYTDNVRALAEMARVLTSGGALILKIHHARYYTIELREAIRGGRVKSAIHACRVLVAGCLYHLTGSQPRGWLTGGETFQTLWLLRRELRRHGLSVERLLADSVPAAPTLLIRR